MTPTPTNSMALTGEQIELLRSLPQQDLRLAPRARSIAERLTTGDVHPPMLPGLTYMDGAGTVHRTPAGNLLIATLDAHLDASNVSREGETEKDFKDSTPLRSAPSERSACDSELQRIDGKHVYAATNRRGEWMIWMQDDRPPIEKLLRGPEATERDDAEGWVRWWDQHIDYWRTEAVDPAEYRQMVEAMRLAGRYIEGNSAGVESTRASSAIWAALEPNRRRSLAASKGSDTEWIVPSLATTPTDPEHEQCTYCREWFPKPVGLHHAESDCVGITTPTDHREPEGDPVTAERLKIAAQIHSMLMRADMPGGNEGSALEMLAAELNGLERGLRANPAHREPEGDGCVRLTGEVLSLSPDENWLSAGCLSGALDTGSIGIGPVEILIRPQPEQDTEHQGDGPVPNDQRFTTGTLAGDLRGLADLMRKTAQDQWETLTESSGLQEVMTNAQHWRGDCMTLADGIEQAAGLANGAPKGAVVNIARCPEHGLHGLRTECFVCGGPVEQVPMSPFATGTGESVESVFNKLNELSDDEIAEVLGRFDGYFTEKGNG